MQIMVVSSQKEFSIYRHHIRQCQVVIKYLENIYLGFNKLLMICEIMQDVSHVAILAQQYVLALVSMVALAVQVVVKVVVVLHVTVESPLMDVLAASPGAQAAQVHAKDVVVVVEVHVRWTVVVAAIVGAEVVVVVTVVTHAQMGALFGAVIQLE